MATSPVDHPRPWRRIYVAALLILAISFALVCFSIATVMRPIPGQIQITPGKPGATSTEWNSRGLVWRKWGFARPSTQPAHATVLKQANDFGVVRTGISEYAPGGMVFPYRYWEMPIIDLSVIGGLGMLASAGLFAYGHFNRDRGMLGRCAVCGYDLTGTPGPIKRCPECGNAT
jgi:hypothetical protein